MASMQDRQKTMTVEQLRRRYNLDDIGNNKKAVQLVKESLNKTENELNDFVKVTTENISSLKDQVDGNISTWFLNGVPSLENEPARNWNTDADRNNHLGDLYYDKDTGYAYRFTLENNTYSWLKLTDSDVTEALAIANSAKDTADSKRRVFVITPTPPYDIGDIWIKDDSDLYRCRSSRVAEDKFNTADWIIATKYTDDTVALQTKGELDQFKVEVEENYTSSATFETAVNSITGRVNETYTYITTVDTTVQDINANITNNMYNKEQIDSMQSNAQQNILEIKNTVEIKTTATEQEINVIKEQINNGVSKVTTTTGSFDENGLHIEKTGEEMNSHMDWDGMVVKRDNDEVLSVRSNGVNAENITVRKYWIQDPVRIEKASAISNPNVFGLGFFAMKPPVVQENAILYNNEEILYENEVIVYG